jgi:RNA polymerase sigma-70 factor, ECF subfamily
MMTAESESTSTLIARCAAGDRAAFRRLYDLWAPRLNGIALRITHQPSMAADATHDAFVQLWRHAGRFDPARGTGEAFLVTLVRYRALDLIRRTMREVPGYEPAEEPDDRPDALALLTATAEGNALHRCLALLEPERRRLVVMAFVDGLSHSALAERLGQPLGTIKSSIRRALLSLRGCLAS